MTDNAQPVTALVKDAQVPLGRRGILAGVGVLLAGALVKVSERVALAADGDPVLQGVVNGPYTGSTQLIRTVNPADPNQFDVALFVENNNGDAIGGIGNGPFSTGVFG